MELSTAQKLQQIRESQGVSLEEIAQKTRIPLTYLQALEAGDEESIPSKVQLRGFLRLYASELGVDLEDLRVGDYHLTRKELTKAPADPEIETDQEPSASNEQQPSETGTTAEIEEADKTELEPEPENEFDLPPSQSSASEPAATTESDKSQTSTEIFKAIGLSLKKRRELLSISLKTVHENTHIQEQHLRSLESGNYDTLPSPVTAKGMLDNYADFLSLDTDAILLEYSEGLQKQLVEKQSAENKRGRRAARELSPTSLRLKNFFTLDLLVISALFITFAGFVIWGVNRILADQAPGIPDNDIPGVSDILLAEETPTPSIPDDFEIIEIDEEGLDEEAAADDDEDEPLFGIDLDASPINIILLPRQRLWVEVTADENIVYEGRLLPGNAYDFSAQDQIDVLTGNIGSLQIIFNNEDIGSQGLIGQVATLSFTEIGLISADVDPPTITDPSEITPTPDEPEENND